jgi:Zn-dependent peptidase ImmA (M78 family)
MQMKRRAARAARAILQAEGATIPVPVEDIAKKHGLIVRERLPAEISGMLVPLPQSVSNLKWAIVINDLDPPVRQRFTIAHELGHLLLHKYAAPHADGRVQVRFRDEESAKGSVREEIEANQFAAELLMPEEQVRAHLRLGHDMMDSENDPKIMRLIQTLAKRFGVSVQALSLRIGNLTVG